MCVFYVVLLTGLVEAVADFTTIAFEERRRLSVIHALGASFMPVISLTGQATCARTVREYLVYRLQYIQTASMSFGDLCEAEQGRASVVAAIKTDGGSNIPQYTATCYDAYMETFAEQIIKHKSELCPLFTSGSAATGWLLAIVSITLALM